MALLIVSLILCLHSAGASSRRRASPAPPPVPPIPPTSSQLPFWSAARPDVSKPLAGYEQIPNATNVGVYFGSAAGGWYNHAAMITLHKDVGSSSGHLFSLSWKNAPVSEDTPGQRVLLKQSEDGLAWGPPTVLFPNMSTVATPVAQFAGPFAVLGGRLYATATPAVIADGDAQGAQWCQWPDGLEPRNCATPDRPGTQPRGILLMRRVYPAADASAPLVPKLGPIFWADPAGPAPDVYAAAAAANGVLRLADTDAQTRADVAQLAHISSPTAARLPCDPADGTLKCEAVPGGSQRYSGLPHIGLANERAHWALPDGTADVVAYRSHSKALYAAVRQHGRAQADWPANVTLTSIPNDDSNINAGQLPGARGAFLVGNLAPNKIRDPLTLAVARDGRNFSSCRTVASCTRMLPNSTCTPRRATNHDSGPSYPQALTVVAPAPPAIQGLFVVSTNNKEDVVVTKLPWSSV
eukprot:g2008.t1